MVVLIIAKELVSVTEIDFVYRRFDPNWTLESIETVPVDVIFPHPIVPVVMVDAVEPVIVSGTADLPNVIDVVVSAPFPIANVGLLIDGAVIAPHITVPVPIEIDDDALVPKILV